MSRGLLDTVSASGHAFGDSRETGLKGVRDNGECVE